MSDAVQSSATTHEWFQPAWLPPGGRGNGLSTAELAADTWAPIADIDMTAVDAVLEALRIALVPAYAAPAGTTREAIVRHRPGRRWRLWVVSLRYGAAEQVLLTTLPKLSRPAAE
jgi:hypothetical protein